MAALLCVKEASRRPCHGPAARRCGGGPNPPVPNPPRHGKSQILMGMQGEITFEQIRERAYELWERNHRAEGFEINFWLMAERELKAERKRALSGRQADEPEAAPSAETREGDQGAT